MTFGALGDEDVGTQLGQGDRRLATAVVDFGKGREPGDIKPAGATEIRTLSSEFNIMRNRIQRMIIQRTDMLAGVSHDLRTPLTRIKLQLALMADSPETANLQADIGEMESLVEEYLAFAAGEGAEEVVVADVDPARVAEVRAAFPFLADRRG